MNGGSELTPRSRSQRTRRPPKQYDGALSWNEASTRVRNQGRGQEEAEQWSETKDEDGIQEGEKEMEGDDVESQDMSIDGYDGNTSDEFVPDEDVLNHVMKSVQEDDFGSDSGEEFGNSNQSQEDSANEQEEVQDFAIDPRLYPNQPIQHEMTASDRLNRAKQRMWIPPLGHGGLENPDAWREAGERNRQLQKQAGQEEEEGEVDVEEDEIQ